MTAVREAVVEEALSWLGTPYGHRQRLKGLGVDCAQLPLAVYQACGLIASAEPAAYAAQWHLHRGEELFLAEVAAMGGREVARDAARAGDLAIWRYGRAFSHGAILTGRGGEIVHAVRGCGVVLADMLREEDLKRRAVKFCSLLDA